MTAIEWAHHAHSVVDGCSPASPGCDNCYAARLSGTRLKHNLAKVVNRVGKNTELVRVGRRADDPTKKRYIYNGLVSLNTVKLQATRRIPRHGGKAGSRVFWNHKSDTFHERLSFTELAAQFAVMAARPDLKFMVLTKRPERAKEFFAWLTGWALHEDRCGYGSALSQAYLTITRQPLVNRRNGRWQVPAGDTSDEKMWPLPNVALGVSAEDQKRWDERVPILLELPAAMRFVSAEPMIGPIDPVIRGSRVSGWDEDWVVDPLTGFEGASPRDDSDDGPRIDQVIIGAESGPGARPMDLRWAQDLAKAVLDARGSLFVKQAAVCPRCAGAGQYRLAGRSLALGCMDCGGGGGELVRALRRGCGIGGKVRKGCPSIYVPGHGTKSWAQFPAGWE